MTTLVLDEKTEQTTIAELLREATGRTVEIRAADGELIATLELSTVKDGFDYGPYLDEARRIADEYRTSEPDSRPWLTTEQFLEKLHRLESTE